jgi:dipeptidyl-peptidase 4
MTKLIWLPLIFLLLPIILIAQARLLTIEDASNMSPKLSPATLSQLQWRPGTGLFVFVAKNSLVQGSSSFSRRDTLMRLVELNLLLRQYQQDSMKRFPVLTFLNANQFYFTNANSLFIYDLLKKILKVENSWTEKAENVDIDTATKSVAYTRDNNLFIAVEGKEKAVTDESNHGIVYGSNRVHRNEFGIDKGTFWSPDGRYLAFYRMDESKVAEYPLVDITQRIATVNPTKYPMAGMTSHKVTVGVYSIINGTTIYLQTDSPPGTDSALRIEYLTNITWSPDARHIYIATLNRDQNFMQLNKYEAVTGKFVMTMFEEKNDTYVEPLQGVRFISGKPDKFLWESRRDGFNHLYLYDTAGNLIKQVTKGPWEVTGFLNSEKNGSRVWFLCNKDNPLDRQLYVADLKNSTIAQVTTVPGTHVAKISADGRFILDSYTSTAISRQIELLDAKGKRLETLLAGDNPLKDIQLGEMSIFSLKNEENNDLYCRLIKPVNFDPGKKYPAIIYVYGGPHSQLITDSWLGGAGLFLNYLAGLGYVVFTMDNRGTSFRGRDFEQAIFRNLGIKEASDQMIGVNYLKSLQFVDSTRLGINGWSYGGFMTVTMFLKHPGTFKVAACGGPVIDWKYYEVMYGERYMDTPESNPEGYKNACLLNYVKNLKGKLLIIHDDQDGTVVPQNSLTFLKKCVDEGKQVDFFIYPGHEHNVRGKDRVHLNQKLALYFQENL